MDGVDTLEISRPKIEEKITSEETPSLKEIHKREADELITLSKLQNGTQLDEAQNKRREYLQRKFDFGLFQQGLSDTQRQSMEDEFNFITKVEEQILENPKKVAERYQELGRKLIREGLTPEENQERLILDVYAVQGKLSPGF